MLEHFASRVRAEAEQTAQTAAIGLFATLAIATGLAFWTLAVWLFLLTVTTAINAAVILGAFYTGAGLVGFAIASVRRKKPVSKPQQPQPPEATLESLLTAFMSGMNAGAKARS